MTLCDPDGRRLQPPAGPSDHVQVVRSSHKQVFLLLTVV
jgi:hypothetical protein